MKLFDLFATLVLDTSGFEEGIQKSTKSAGGFGSALVEGFKTAGGAAVKFLSSDVAGRAISFVRGLADEVSEAGDKIDKQSQALGMSRKAYQEWDYILSQSGSSIDSLGTSMKTLNSAVLNTIADPKKNKDMVGVFKELGLSMTELNGLTQESQFEKVVRAFQQLPAGAEKSALAVKLFGKNGQDLLPLLNSSAESIDEMRQRAEELGLIMSDDAIDAAAAYNDALDDMGRTFTAVKYAAGATFLPVLTKVFNKVANFTGELLNAYKEGGLSGMVSHALGKIGDFAVGIDFPKWSDIKGTAESWWNDSIAPALSNVLVAAFGVSTEDADKAVGRIKEMWTFVEHGIETFFKVTFALLIGDPGEAIDALDDFWSKDIWPNIQDYFRVTFGIDMPDWGKVKDKIQAGWEWVKKNLNLGLSVGAFNYSGGDFGTALGGLNLPDLSNVTPSFDGIPGLYDVGLDYVPYNEFPAYLHEGEAVLTKSEATAWRNGGAAQQNVDLSTIKQDIIDAVREGMDGIGVYMDRELVGHAVAQTVSGDIAGLAWAGRYR